MEQNNGTYYIVIRDSEGHETRVELLSADDVAACYGLVVEYARQIQEEQGA